MHKPAVYGGWEGRGLACEFRTCCHFGQDDPARNFEDGRVLRPSLRKLA